MGSREAATGLCLVPSFGRAGFEYSGGLLSLKFQLVHSDPDPIQAHDHALGALREFSSLVPFQLLFL